MVPLRTKLKNGDIVEIVRQAGHKPSRDWLNFVATSRARNKIKHLIHAEEKTRAVELGRKLFEKEARRYDLNPKTIVDGEALREGADRIRASARPTICLRRSATARSQPKQVLVRLVPADSLREKPPEGAVASVVRRVLGSARRRSRSGASTT